MKTIKKYLTKLSLPPLMSQLLIALAIIGSDFHPTFIEWGPNQACAADRKFNDDVGTTNQQKPTIAMNKYGYGIMVWQDLRNGNEDIYGQIFTQRGTLLLKNFKINDDAGSSLQVSPDVAVDNQGHFVVVWEDRADSVNVYAQLLAANGTKINSKIRVNRAGTKNLTMKPVVAADTLGNFVVCWIDRHEELQGNILAQRFDRTGRRLGDQILVNSETRGPQDSPAVSVNDQGDFIVAWEDGRDLHSTIAIYAIYAQRFTSLGVPVGSNQQVSRHPSGTLLPSNPCVALHNSNDFMVSWQFGNPSRIYGNSYSADLMTRTKMMAISDTLSGDDNIEPDIVRHSNTQYMLAWSKKRSGQYHIYYQVLNYNGVLAPSELLISDDIANQRVPSISNSNKGVIVVFQDNRNSHDDIYANWLGPRVAINVYAGSGFNGMAPITWDPPYGDESVTQYKIERAESPAGPYVQRTIVNLATRGPLGSLMRDWVDTEVVNGTTYYYRVEAITPGSNGPSIFCSAKPAVPGHTLSSSWATITPAIDGNLQSNEWDDATIIPLPNAYTLMSLTLYIKNSDTHLYIGIDDPNDTIIDPANILGIVFDEDNNAKWDDHGPSREGAITISNSGALFTGYWGMYPDHLGGDTPKTATGVQSKISTANGHVQYEVALDLLASPLNAAMNQILGMLIWVADPGQFYPTHYGNSGEWPLGGLWDCAQPLGQVQLAEPVNLTPNLDWPMINQGRERRSWVKDEKELAPPFSTSRSFATLPSNVEELVFKNQTLYVIASSANHTLGDRAIYAFDYATGSLRWSFVFPNSQGSVSFTPAVSDSLVLCYSQTSPGLYALHTLTGQQKWFKPYTSLRLCNPIIDQDRVYLVADSLFCLKLQTGSVLWKQQQNVRFLQTTPVVDQTNVYYANQIDLFCYNKFTGALVWQAPNTGQASVMVDPAFLYTNHTNGIVARKKTDGSIQWTYPIPGGGLTGENNVMAVTDSLVCFVRHDYPTYREQVFALDKQTGTQLWRQSYDSTIVTNPIIANGIIYLGLSGRMHSIPSSERHFIIGLDARTGGERFRAAKNSGAYQPIIAQHTLFVPNNWEILTFNNSPITGAPVFAVSLPHTSYLQQNYPNPFNSTTAIHFQMAVPGPVTLSIYNALGQLVCSLFKDEQKDAGTHEIIWDGYDSFGHAVPSAVYFYSLQAHGFSETRKLLLVR